MWNRRQFIAAAGATALSAPAFAGGARDLTRPRHTRRPIVTMPSADRASSAGSIAERYLVGSRYRRRTAHQA